MKKVSNQDTLKKTMELLKKIYGVPEPSERPDPVKSVIKTILSQNTNDKNRDIAAGRLFKKFGSLEEILEADNDEVLKAVRPAGLGPTKSRRIQNFLSRLKEEEGKITLDKVKNMNIQEAKNYLQKFDGIGPKTAAVTLLFVFDKPVMPVDTHVHRVTKRIGIILKNTGRKKAHDILEKKVPKERMYEFHINLIKHGRQVCHARNPECGKCSLKNLCRYFKEEKR